MLQRPGTRANPVEKTGWMVSGPVTDLELARHESDMLHLQKGEPLLLPIIVAWK